MADAGATIVICPMAEIALAIGSPPTGRAREAGLAPAYGSDAVCSASGDLFDEARIALLTERSLRARRLFDVGSEVTTSEDLGFTSVDAIRGITVDAAVACWLEGRVGSLSVGMCADLVLFLRELDPSIASVGDIQATVVAAAHGSNVDTVIVDGEIVKRGGAFPGIERRLAAAAGGGRRPIFADANAALERHPSTAARRSRLD